MVSRELPPLEHVNVRAALDAWSAAADADLLFLLTTGRADLLEPALVARPGRVDIAVQIDRPDAIARVTRTDGVTASFSKELVRRSVLEALHESGRGDHDVPVEDDTDETAAVTVGFEHVPRGLDDLLDSTQSVTRTLLGVSGGTAESAAAGQLQQEEQSDPHHEPGAPRLATVPPSERWWPGRWKFRRSRTTGALHTCVGSSPSGWRRAS